MTHCRPNRTTLCFMGVNRAPRQLALGATLREVREAAGYSLREFATKIGVSPSGLSLWETGKRTPQATDVAKILTALNINGARYQDILNLAQDADAPRWLAVSLPEQRQHLNALLRFERDAEEIIDIAPLLPTGLLQTEDYIRAMMVAGGVAASEVETRVRVRLGRQKVLDSVRLTALIGEAALHQAIGGHDVLLGQLRHLAAMSDHENVTLRVVPFTAGWYPAVEGPWTVIKSKSADAPTMIHLENRRSGLWLHEDADVSAYIEAVAAVLKVAMSPKASVELIAKKIKQLEKMRHHDHTRELA